ncbi:hypothetical protein N9V13_02350 [Betaproteobacteria bacterium]|nr:hypothetical protein [Betaproteobacteria bacterium]
MVRVVFLIKNGSLTRELGNLMEGFEPTLDDAARLMEPTVGIGY